MKNIEKTKAKLLAAVENNEYLAVTGRVKDWLKSPESRYPQSCTVLSLKDSMEGEEGIEYGWLYTSKGLRFASGVAINFSEIRPAGTENGKGLTASGPVSFMKINSVLNEILRRGGTFKNGAVVVYLSAEHPDLVNFLETSTSELLWAKKALYVSDNPADENYILNPKFTEISIPERKTYETKYVLAEQSIAAPGDFFAKTEPLYKKVVIEHVRPACSLLDLILEQVANGTLFLAKIRYDEQGHRIYSNVCMEILIKSRATCLLSHVNLGQIKTPSHLRKAFVSTMKFLCELHSITGAGKDNYYLPPKVDKQVGLGVIGLANYLAKFKISYAAFADALYDFAQKFIENRNAGRYRDALENTAATLGFLTSMLHGNEESTYSEKELSHARYFFEAFHDAAKIAYKKGMKRAFTVAPTASCAYRYVDTNGFTTTPEISPPIAHAKTKRTVRDSSTFGREEFQYPLNVETAAEVGYPVYFKLSKAWQLMMESTGLAHAISHNVWASQTIDKEWFTEWLESPLVTTYYRLLEDQAFVDKSSISPDEDSLEEEQGFFMPVSDDEDEEQSSCSLDGFCSACAE